MFLSSFPHLPFLRPSPHPLTHSPTNSVLFTHSPSPPSLTNPDYPLTHSPVFCCTPLQVVDVVLPLISSRKMRMRSTRALSSLHNLLATAAAISLRPEAIVLTHALSAAEPFLPVRGYNCPVDAVIEWSTVLVTPHLPSAEDDDSDEVLSAGVLDWLPCVLALLKIMSTMDELALTTNLQSVLRQREDAAQGAPPERVLAEFMLVAVRVVAMHFTKDTTIRSDVLSQQFAQLLQFTYVLLSGGSTSPVVIAARELAADHCGV